MSPSNLVVVVAVVVGSGDFLAAAAAAATGPISVAKLKSSWSRVNFALASRVLFERRNRPDMVIIRRVRIGDIYAGSARRSTPMKLGRGAGERGEGPLKPKESRIAVKLERQTGSAREDFGQKRDL